MRYRPRDRELAIELSLELLATGRVRGIPLGHSPEDLERLLGPPACEGILEFSGNLLRDWGLLEAYYEREYPAATWRGTLFMGQLHRMPKPLKWKLIARELRNLGYEVMPEAMPTLDDNYFRVYESGAGAVVFGTGNAPDRMRGHIAKISSAERLSMGRPSDAFSFNAIHRTVHAAVTGPENDWNRWLGRQARPHAEWYELAHGAIHLVVDEHPERIHQATTFHDWLLSQADAAQVWSGVERALLYARCVAGDASREPLPARPGVPSADQIIGGCLALLPLSRESARSLPTDWRTIEPSDVRRCRVTRTLVLAANALRDRATAPNLIAELTAWHDVLPDIC
ncbi:hypothetical protein ACIA8K_34180 [Catenuloplanes sp. NPDC051500]|uniref:hypothetical protein n=1 Tax=Catenuloplanes sp. NPDC051500 TaxID=3363959 RepID=UPI00379BBB12